MMTANTSAVTMGVVPFEAGPGVAPAVVEAVTERVAQALKTQSDIDVVPPERLGAVFESGNLDAGGTVKPEAALFFPAP